jgi:hypothetical protein
MRSKEIIQEYNKYYYQKNKEILKNKDKQRYYKNKAIIDKIKKKEYDRQRYLQIQESKKEYRLKNKDKFNKKNLCTVCKRYINVIYLKKHILTITHKENQELIDLATILYNIKN